MEIVKPFGVAQLIKDQVVTNDKMIHFILPVSSSVSDRFQDFLHYFEDICLQTLGTFSLVLYANQMPPHNRKSNLKPNASLFFHRTCVFDDHTLYGPLGP